MINAVYINGPKAGHSIELKEPVPTNVIVHQFIHLCEHRLELNMPSIAVNYQVEEIKGKTTGGIKYRLRTGKEHDYFDSAYSCIKCNEDAKVKYKVKKLSKLFDELFGDEDDQ